MVFDPPPNPDSTIESPAATQVFPGEAPNLEERRKAIDTVPCLSFWPTQSVSITKGQGVKIIYCAAVDDWPEIHIFHMAFRTCKSLPQTDTCIISSQGLSSSSPSPWLTSHHWLIFPPRLQHHFCWRPWPPPPPPPDQARPVMGCCHTPSFQWMRS